jgi:hypothetical protein
MPERRPRRDAGAPGGLADADRLRPALADQLQRGVDQDPPEIAVVIRFWRGGARHAAAGFGDVSFGNGRFGGSTHGLSYHHRLVNVSTDYTD